MTSTPATDPVGLLPDGRVEPGGLAVPSSEPYPWPYDGAAAAGHTALVVVAAQAGLVPLCPTAGAALGVVAALSAAARAWGATVVATRHAASPAQRRPGILAPAGDDAWQLAARLFNDRLLNDTVFNDTVSPDAIIDAFGMDGFSGSPLAEYLAGHDLDHILVCGLGLEGPVHSTLRSANDRGLECLLVIDGCAPLNPTLADAGVRIIEKSGGIFGAVATSEAVLQGLATDDSAGAGDG